MNRNLIFALLTMAVATSLAAPAAQASAADRAIIVTTAATGTCSNGSICVLNSGDCTNHAICVLNSGSCDDSTCIWNYMSYLAGGRGGVFRVALP